MVQKRKRQRKGSVPGQFRCLVEGCKKAYLSYPALSTHVKTKHDGKKDLMDRPPTNGKRGRPPRVEIQGNQADLPPLSLRIQIEQKQCIDDFLLEIVEMGCKSILQQEGELLKNKQIVSHVGQVFKFLEIDESKFLNVLRDCLEQGDYAYEIRNHEQLAYITTDEAISQYLRELSFTVNLSFLQSVALNYMLELGKLTPNDPPRDMACYINRFMEEKHRHFSQEHLLKFCTFIGDENKILLDATQGERILEKIGLHFCNWLFSSRYSIHNLQLNPQQPQ